MSSYRLKSLELNGYKTFATKTVFEFAGQVTAVVGPNGSGKSNIADALRWVLGEQSYRLLRGSRTDDMIFSGSDRRARAGMASATVVFDNSDGWLPIDFSEVSITRRAYRDGQNEYLINNQKVRLRDVNEILANSGLAERTYTVIGQGLVDAALSLRADERRRLFEEAAGIGLYRSRKEQALRRLDATKRNLERVQDILAELKPRLRSLERQARRAQEYERVKSELREVLREWYGFHWHRAQLGVKRARDLAQMQQANVAQLSEKQAKLSDNLTGLRETIYSLRSRLGSWHSQMSELHRQREAVSRDLAVAEERQRSLEEQRQLLEGERARSEKEREAHQARLAETEKRVELLQAEVAEAEAKSREAGKDLEDRQAGQKRVLEFEARKLELQNRLEHQRGRQEELAGALEGARQKVGAAEEQQRVASREKEQAKEGSQRTEAQLRETRTRLESLEGQRKSLETEQAKVQAEIAGLQTQLEVLEEAERSLAGYESGARKLLEAARGQGIEGVRGALSQSMQVPAELQTAVSAALGRLLDAILVDNAHSLEGALAYLSAEPSRAALIPLVGLAPPKRLAAPVDDGCLGVAADLVEAPGELRPVLELLLGRVLVVREREDAWRLLKGLPDGASLVTLRGEVFQANGEVIVDSVGAHGSLDHAGQRKAIQEDLERLEKRAQEGQAQRESLELQRAQLQHKVDELVGALEIAGRRHKQAEESYAEVELDATAAKREQEWLERQSAELEQELGATKTDLEAMRSEELRESEEPESEASGAKELEVPLVTLQDRAAHLNTRLAVAKRALEEALSRREERRLALQQGEERLATLTARGEALREQRSQIQADIQRSRKAEKQFGQEVQSLQALVEPAEAELQAAEGEQIEMQSAERASRKSLNNAERQYSQAQIAHARQQEALETLRQRVEDDFGLVEFEYDESISGPKPLPLGELVEKLPQVPELSAEVEATLKRLRAQLRQMGAINHEAQMEYKQVQERFEFLTSQVEDLTAAQSDVTEVIAELDTLMERDFRKTFDLVAAEFREVFTRLFGGGSAHLMLTEAEDMAETGIEIEAKLPGKRSQTLASLSGGERSLTAAALVFALLKASPTPFCVMDEVDAMLDEANIARFRQLLEEFSRETQFVVITHNRGTVQVADVIYGITMGRDTSSQVISLKLDEVDDRYSE